jgi:hypothetical protein
MVGQQVRRYPELGLQFRRGEVTQGQPVHYTQPRRICERGMLCDPRPKGVDWLNIHWFNFD